MLTAHRTRRWFALIAALMTSAFLMAPGAASARTAPVPTLSSLAKAARDVAPGTADCFPGSHPGETKVLTCNYGHRGPRVLLIGDSHLRALSPAFRRLAHEDKMRVTLIIRSRCGWSTREIKNQTTWIRDDCQAWRRNVNRYIARHRDIAAIVTNHRSSTMPGTAAQRGPDTVAAWRPALRRKIAVIAVSDSANWVLSRPAPVDCLRQNSNYRQWKNCSDATADVMWFDWTRPAVTLARQKYGRTAAFQISMRNVYCPRKVCRVVTPRGQIMYRDRQHLTATFTRALAPWFEKRLRRVGVLP